MMSDASIHAVVSSGTSSSTAASKTKSLGNDDFL